jgi:hypothetical protein
MVSSNLAVALALTERDRFIDAVQLVALSIAGESLLLLGLLCHGS